MIEQRALIDELPGGDRGPRIDLALPVDVVAGRWDLVVPPRAAVDPGPGHPRGPADDAAPGRPLRGPGRPRGPGRRWSAGRRAGQDPAVGARPGEPTLRSAGQPTARAAAGRRWRTAAPGPGRRTTAVSLRLVSTSSLSGSEPSTMPTPAANRADRSSTVMARIPSIQHPVAPAVDVAHRTGVVTPGVGLESVDEGQGGRGPAPRPPPAWDGGPATSSRAVGAAPSGRRGQRPGDGGAQMGDGCGGGPGRDGREPSSSAQSGARASVDRLDHQAVLVAVLGRGRAARRAGVPLTRPDRPVVPASGRLRTWGPVRSTSSSGLAPTNWPSGVGTENTVQLGSSRCHRRSRSATSMACAHGHVDLTGQHHLGHLARGRWRRAASATMARKPASDGSGDDAGRPAPPRLRSSVPAAARLTVRPPVRRPPG